MISCNSTFEQGNLDLWRYINAFIIIIIIFAGINGQEYMFLLKGHEDLRQDERVMQLFGLVNSLLLNTPETFRRNLTCVV